MKLSWVHKASGKSKYMCGVRLCCVIKCPRVWDCICKLEFRVPVITESQKVWAGRHLKDLTPTPLLVGTDKNFIMNLSSCS